MSNHILLRACDATAIGSSTPLKQPAMTSNSIAIQLPGIPHVWGSARHGCRHGRGAVRSSAAQPGPRLPPGPGASAICSSIANTARGSGRRRRQVAPLAAAASQDGPQDSRSPSGSQDALRQPTYTLEDTRTLVETAMLAAVSGLTYLISTILKLENSLGYFLPLPVVLAALRSGAGAGWRTMTATCFLLIVLLGPLRALSYFFLHGVLAATLGSLWRLRVNFWLSIAAGAAVRMAGQLAYLKLSSVAMNENLFAVILSNIHNTLDQVTAAMGVSGSPSPLVVSSMIFSLLLVNGCTYCFLVHVVYRVVLGTMGYQLGPLPPLVNNWLRAGVVQREQQRPA